MAEEEDPEAKTVLTVVPKAATADRPAGEATTTRMTDAWHGGLQRAESEPAGRRALTPTPRASDQAGQGGRQAEAFPSDGRGGRAVHGTTRHTVPHAFHGSGSCLRPRRAPHLVLTTPKCTRTRLVLPSLAPPPAPPPPYYHHQRLLSSAASHHSISSSSSSSSFSSHPPLRPRRRWSAAASSSSRRRRRIRAAVPRRRHPRWGAARSRSSGSRTPPTGR